MKIALIISMKYGINQFIYRDIEALMDKGHDVRIFTLLNKRGLYNPKPGWKVISISPLRTILKQFTFFIRRPRQYVDLLMTAVRTKSLRNLSIAVGFEDQMGDIDVIYATFGDHKLFTGYYCKRITGLPLLVIIHAYELYRNPNPKIFVESLEYCDRVITVTEHNRSVLAEKYAVPPDKVEIVRQIVDLENYRFKQKIKILIVGFFAEKKGHEVLFKAIREMDRQDIELWVVGDVNPSVTAVDCRSLAKELGIDSQVAFFGAQTGVALRALYQECDIFCLPSHTDRFGDKEGFPTVIAEAMSFGKPVVSTIHVGIPEALDAILVEENNVAQLADALNQVCDSAELRRKLGGRNRIVAEAMFSPANTDKLEEILKQYVHTDEVIYPVQLEIYQDAVHLQDEKSYK